MKKILIFSFDQMEDIEFTSFLDVSKRLGNEVDFFSLNQSKITTKFNLEINNPKQLDELNLDSYDALYLPGGPGVNKIIDNPDLGKVIDYFVSHNKIVIAMCAAPQILAKRGHLKNHQAIAFQDEEIYQLMEKHGVKIVNRQCDPTDKSCNIVRDRNFITALNYRVTIELAEFVDQELKKQVD